MKILVVGGAGLLGRAITHALRLRDHQVVTVDRCNADVTLDLAHEAQADVLAALVRGADVVVNTAGVLIERGDNRFDALHVNAPRALALACDEARVARLVHVSALGAGTGIPSAYMRSKEAGEQAIAQTLQGSSTDYALVRPSLLVDDACPSTRLFKWLAVLPVIALPGLLRPGASRLAPLQARDAAECIARICEHEKALKKRNAGVVELTGPEVLSYRDMMRLYRAQAGGKRTLWLPTPWWLMRLVARLAEFIPNNHVLSRDTVRLLRAAVMTDHNDAAHWLRRMPISVQNSPLRASPLTWTL